MQIILLKGLLLDKIYYSYFYQAAKLNFKPKYNLEEGLRLTYEWFKEQNFTEEDLQ